MEKRIPLIEDERVFTGDVDRCSLLTVDVENILCIGVANYLKIVVTRILSWHLWKRLRRSYILVDYL